MRPIFTVHAGEYIVGTAIEKTFPDLRVWIPSKDTGVDILVTDENQGKVASLQVKFSKDYLGTAANSSGRSEIESGGWWKLSRQKIADSPADLWVMVLYQFQTRKFDFVVVPPQDLLERYDRIAGKRDVIQSYFWVTAEGSCWETRGLSKTDLDRVRSGTFENEARNFTAYLNAWPF